MTDREFFEPMLMKREEAYSVLTGIIEKLGMALRLIDELEGGVVSPYLDYQASLDYFPKEDIDRAKVFHDEYLNPSKTDIARSIWRIKVLLVYRKELEHISKAEKNRNWLNKYEHDFDKYLDTCLKEWKSED